MTGGGDVTENFESAGGVALDISDCDKENHDGVRGFVGTGGRGPADNALEICTFKIPTSTVGGPDLCFESIVGKVGGQRFSLPFLH